MRPPKGFENEKYPLRHRLIHGFGLSLGDDTLNTAFIPLVMGSLDMASDDPETIVVNPHNTAYVKDEGPLVRQMSIIDRLSISIKFAMTGHCDASHMDTGTFGANGQTAGTFMGTNIPAISFLWRPIFNVYPEKMDAADDDTGTTVAAILGMTKDATFEDIVPVTTTKLPTTPSPSDTNLPMSSVNDVQVLGDYNMSASTTMEDHVFDEDLLQEALMRYTNRGALRSCLGRTRFVTLTRARPYLNVFINKPVPRAIRRVQSYSLFGIQVHLYVDTDNRQQFLTQDANSSFPHLGVKMLTHFHEWNVEHDQSMIPPA